MNQLADSIWIVVGSEWSRLTVLDKKKLYNKTASDLNITIKLSTIKIDCYNTIKKSYSQALIYS